MGRLLCFLGYHKWIRYGIYPTSATRKCARTGCRKKQVYIKPGWTQRSLMYPCGVWVNGGWANLP